MGAVIEQKEIGTGLLLMISSHPSPSQMPTNVLNLSGMPPNGLNPLETPLKTLPTGAAGRI